MSLRIILEDYKKVTEMLVQAIKSGETGEVFIEDRGKLLEDIKGCDFDKSDLKRLC